MPYPVGTRKPSRDRGHHLEAKVKARARSSVIGAANVTAVLARREPAQHGVGSVAFAMTRIITGQSVGRPLKDRREEEAQSQYQKQGKGKSPGKTGKAKAKHAHSVVFKMVPSAKGIVSRLEERASVSNSVTSEPTVPLSKAAKQGNLVLSGNILKHLSLPAMCSFVTQSTTRGMAH